MCICKIIEHAADVVYVSKAEIAWHIVGYFWRKIYHTQGKEIYQLPKHLEVGWKMRHKASFFNQLWSVLISNEALFRVFNIIIASQNINNSLTNSKQKFTEFYDNKYHCISKPPSQQ